MAATTHVGPMAGQQFNCNVYVADGGFQSIQSAVDYLTEYSSAVGMVIIEPDYTGSDTIASVVRGAYTIRIVDRRALTPQIYFWYGTKYDFLDFQQGGAIACFRDGIESGIYPPAAATALSSPYPGGWMSWGQFGRGETDFVNVNGTDTSDGFSWSTAALGAHPSELMALDAEGILAVGPLKQFAVGDIGVGYTALTLNGQLANGQRVGMSSSASDPELYLDTQTLFTFESNPTIFAKISAEGLSIGDFPGAPTHRLDIGDDAGNVVAYILKNGDTLTEGLLASSWDGATVGIFPPFPKAPLPVDEPGVWMGWNALDDGEADFINVAPTGESAGFRWFETVQGTALDPGDELMRLDSSGNLTTAGDASITGQLAAEGNLTIGGDGVVAGDFEVGGTCTLAADPTAPLEAATKQYVDAHGGGGGGGMVYPAAGLALSTGTAWGTSIDPATLARVNAANTFAAAQTMGSTLTLNADPAQPLQAATKQYVDAHAGGGGMVYPAAGVAVSTGAAWGTPIAAANLALLNAANTFTANQTVNGMMTSSTAMLAGITLLPTTGSPTYSTLTFNGDDGNGTRLGFIAASTGDPHLYFDVPAGGNFNFRTSNVGIIQFTPSGTNFLGTSAQLVAHIDVAGNASFNGTITGTAKNFRIPYPGEDKALHTLTHSCLEGPEMAVYYRGEVETSAGVALVTLPEYFEALTRDEGRTVLLTQMYDEDEADPEFAMLMASQVRGGQFTVRSSIPVATVAWEVKAVRADQPPLVVVAPAPPKPVQPMVPPPQPQSDAEPQTEPEPQGKPAPAESKKSRRP